MGEPLHSPEGWTLAPLPRQADHVLLSTPPPMSYMATIDYTHRPPPIIHYRERDRCPYCRLRVSPPAIRCDGCGAPL